MKLLRPKNPYFWLVGMLIFVCVASCDREPYWINDDIPPLPSKIKGASDKVVIDLQKKLRQYHIQVISIGQEFMISVPARIMFHDQSPRVKWAAYEQLNYIAEYLKQFRKVEVHVNAYSTKYQSVERALALTTARSRVIGNYLRSLGIDSRFIFTQGLGSDKPISINCGLPGDKSPNSRVEIIFRETIV